MRRARAILLWVTAVTVLGCGARPGRAPAPAPGDPSLAARFASLTLPPTPDGVDTPVIGVSTRAVSPRAAWSGHELLVVWQDFRGVAGARISEAGAIADDAAFHISAGSLIQTPDVASDGQSYFAVWTEMTSPPRVRGALITATPAGDLVAGDPVTIATSPNAGATPYTARVAFGGGNYGVAWVDDDGGSAWQVLFARVSPQGVPLDAAPAVLTNTGQPHASIEHTEAAPDVVWNGQGFVVGWREIDASFGTTISVRRVGPDLALSPRRDAAVAALPAVTGGTTLAFDGDRVWVAWEQADGVAGTTNAAVKIRRMRADAFLEPALTVQTTDHLLVGQPALVFEPGLQDMALAHADGLLQQITFQRLALDSGAPLLPVVPTVSTGGTSQQHPILARGATTTLVAWETSEAAIYGTRLRDTAAPLDAPPLLISRSPNSQYTPAVAGGDAGFAVVWIDTRDGGRRIYGATRSPEGAPLEPMAFGVLTEPTLVSFTGLGFGGAQFLAAGVGTGPTIAGTPILGRRFGADGVPRGEMFTVSTAQMSGIHIAFAGGLFAVAGAGASAVGRNEIRAVRVSPAGAALGTTTIDASGSATGAPVIATDGARFLIAWTAGAGLSGRLLLPDGTLAGTAPLVLSASGSSLSQVEPALAFGGGVYLLAWHDSPNRRIVGELLAADGTVIAPGLFPITAPAADEADAYTGVAFDGTRFVVGWKALQRPGDAGLFQAKEIQYAPVTTAGVVGPIGVVAADDGSGTLTDPVVMAGGGNGRTLVAYTQADAPGGFPIARTRVRFLGPPAPAGGGCQADGDCGQGTCVDGVCCASACAGGPLDCQGCSLLAGAAANGVCAPVPDGQSCGAHGACAAGACRERDAGAPPPALDAGAGGDGPGNGDAIAGDDDAAGDAGAAVGGDGSAGGDAIVGDAPAEVRDASPQPAGDATFPPRDADASDAADAGSAGDRAIDERPVSGGAAAGGCSCRLADSHPGSSWPSALLALGLLGGAARRRRINRRRSARRR